MDRFTLAPVLALIGFAPARFWRVLALCVLAAAIEGVGFLALARLLDLFGFAETIERPDANVLLFALAVYVVLAAVAAWVVRLRTLATSRLRTDFADDLRLRAHRAVLAAEWAGATRANVARIVQTLTTDAVRCSAGAEALLGAAAQAIQILVLFAAAAYLSPTTALSAAALAALAIPASSAADRRARASGVALGEAQQAIAASLTDDVAGLRTVKSFGAEGARAEKLAEQVRRLGEILAGYAAAMGTVRVLGLTLSAAACGALLLAAVALRGVPLVEALVLVGIAARLFAAMARARENWRMALHCAASYEALRQLADEAPAALAPTSPRTRAPLAKGIEMRGLEFAHPGSDQPVLANIDAVLPSGGVVLLTGPSGAGKSTLADLLAGLSAPTQGEIRIDGKALAAGDRAAWRARVGYAAQDAFLFDDTVRANLRLANPAANEVAMARALDLAAADFVRALPQGLDTRVGERGVRLSAGERQRICLAAALLREPDFLVLDETFAPLDPATAARVARGLRSLAPATTILVVAHREIPDLAPDAVFRLEGGKLS